MGPRLSIKIGEKRFSSLPQPLFRGFTLEIEPSSVLALVGPSGVGKSSLLRMIAGIDTDFAGEITIDGRDAKNAAPAGFVFQDARLLPWLSASRNITAVSPATGEAEAGAILGRVGLSGYEAAFPHELSGGMQRRVALARALSVNRNFWLLDEPFVSLDRHLVGELQALFLSMVEAEAPTVVIVTHLPEDAARLATRAVALAGRPVRIAADMALENKPAKRTPQEVLRMSEAIAAQIEATR